LFRRPNLCMNVIQSFLSLLVGCLLLSCKYSCYYYTLLFSCWNNLKTMSYCRAFTCYHINLTVCDEDFQACGWANSFEWVYSCMFHADNTDQWRLPETPGVGLDCPLWTVFEYNDLYWIWRRFDAKKYSLHRARTPDLRHCPPFMTCV